LRRVQIWIFLFPSALCCCHAAAVSALCSFSQAKGFCSATASAQRLWEELRCQCVTGGRARAVQEIFVLSFFYAKFLYIKRGQGDYKMSVGRLSVLHFAILLIFSCSPKSPVLQ